MACAILMLALLQLTSMYQEHHWASRDSQSSDFCATGSLDVDQIENNSQTANNDRNEKRTMIAMKSEKRSRPRPRLLAPNLLYMSPTLQRRLLRGCGFIQVCLPPPQQPSIYMHPHGHTRKSKTNTLQPQD